MEKNDIVVHASIANVIVYDLQELKSHSIEQGFPCSPEPSSMKSIHASTENSAVQGKLKPKVDRMAYFTLTVGFDYWQKNSNNWL